MNWKNAKVWWLNRWYGQPVYWIRRLKIRPSINQIDDLLDEIDKRIKKGDRVLVTTLTKRMAEEMDKYLHRINIKSKYIHSEVDTLERIEILRELRLGYH